MNIVINNNLNSPNISLAASLNSTTKKKSSSKISDLITKAILPDHTLPINTSTYTNDILSRNVNRKMTPTVYSTTFNLSNTSSQCAYSDNDDMFNFDEETSTIHSLGSNATYTQVEVMYSVDEWTNARNVYININEVYTISSLISMSVDYINECLMEDDKEKWVINGNSAMYAVVMAKKNGCPNYNYPEYNEEMKIKDCLKKKFCLIFKGGEGEFLVEKRKLREKRGKYKQNGDNNNNININLYNNKNSWISGCDFYKFRSKSSDLINASYIQDNMKYNTDSGYQSKCILF